MLIQGADDLEKGLEIDFVKEAVNKVYSGFLSASEIALLQDSLDIDGNNILDLEEILQIVCDFVPENDQKIQVNFMICAAILDRNKISTPDYFKEHSISGDVDYLKEEFTANIIGPLRCIDTIDGERTVADYIYDFLESDGQYVRGSDLFEAIDSYRFGGSKTATKKAAKPAPVIKDQQKFSVIQKTDVFKKAMQEIRKNELDAQHLFTLADEEGVGSASVISLKTVFEKMVPGLEPKDVFKMLKLMDSNCNGFVDKAEY